MTDNKDLPENKLPGFGLPRRGGFTHPGATGWCQPSIKWHVPFLLEDDGSAQGYLSGVTLREVRMMGFVNAITDKPDWARKVFDEAIVAKWRAEAAAKPAVMVVEGDEGERAQEDVFLSEAMFDYCIAQLRDKAKTFEATGMVRVLDAELAVVKSDVAVSESLRDELRRCVAVLEDVPEHDKDWHPGSNRQVLDLLHPSLFPVVFGRTRVLPRGTVPLDDCVQFTGQGEVVVRDTDEDKEAAGYHARMTGTRFKDGYGYGLDNFQWLPAEVTLRRDPADATTGPVTANITSYINNLHPRTNRALYAVLARCVAAAVPLWEACLSGYGDRRAIKLDKTDDEDDYYLPPGVRFPFFPRPKPDGTAVKEEDFDASGAPPYGYHGDGHGDADSTGEPAEDEEVWRYMDRYEPWWKEHRILRWLEPEAYPPWGAGAPPPLGRLGNICLTDRAAFPDGVQVIFKLANIHLTPEQPAYAGGGWHIEGTLAERICASALYYYDEDNVTESTLHFRASIESQELEMLPPQDAYSSLETYMGIRNHGPAEQDLGAVHTRPGRLLVFPNEMQHRVAPFRLQDPSRPGHRKLLALFLVEPRRRILSSAVVPPQRRDWWAAQVAHDVPALGQQLPLELYEKTVAAVDDFPIDWATAQQDRIELMAARRGDKYGNGRYKKNMFSFCEH